MTWVASIAALKFVFPAADPVMVHVPAVKVTIPAEMVHAPATANVVLTPEEVPVTVELAVAIGVYVSIASGVVGTGELKATI